MSKRLVVKVGSSSLTGAAGAELDLQAVDALVDALAFVRSRGDEVLLVSSGAIATGLSPLKLKTRPRDLATQQAAAAVGQGLLMHAYASSLARHHLNGAQVLLTAEDVIRRSHYQNAQRTLLRLLDLGVVPIINENDTVATHEIRFGDNDRLAALVAHLVHADELHLLSDVDFLYSGNPSDPTSRPIERISTIRELDEIDTLSKSKSGVGTGGMSTKVEAARIAMSAGISVYLSSAKNAMSMVKGESVGTFFAPSMSKTPSRLLWLAHASSPRGVLQLDPGAVIAVVDRRVSLLPAGVISVSGEFAAGDPVDLAGPDGKVVARGLVAFDSEEIPRMLGKSTKELAQTLGAEFERELVHRDDLVLL